MIKVIIYNHCNDLCYLAPSDPPTLIINENGMKNTSALVLIKPPNRPNGIIRTYKIWIYPTGYDNERRLEVLDISPTQDLTFDVRFHITINITKRRIYIKKRL
jgi:hypothetical protein